MRNTKKVREKSRECHIHKPQPFPDPKRKRKPTNLNKHKPNKRTKSTKISSLFPKRGNRNTKRTEKHKNKMTHGKTSQICKVEIDTKLQEKLLQMEKKNKHGRACILLFYGFSEEGSENIFEKRRKVFVNNLEIDPSTVDNMVFVHGNRMPTENQDVPRPIILRLAHYDDK